MNATLILAILAVQPYITLTALVAVRNRFTASHRRHRHRHRHRLKFHHPDTPTGANGMTMRIEDNILADASIFAVRFRRQRICHEFTSSIHQIRCSNEGSRVLSLWLYATMQSAASNGGNGWPAAVAAMPVVGASVVADSVYKQAFYNLTRFASSRQGR